MPKQIFLFGIVVVLSASIAACKKDSDGNEVIQLPVPRGFPQPVLPADNLPTANRIALGKLLFFDPILSRDSTISCAHCHLEEKYFQDNLAKSFGIDNRIGFRNTPSLLNVAYQPSMFWDGGVPNLEQQVLAPIEAHFEMDFDANKVVERLKKQTTYVSKFIQAYGEPPSVKSLVRAIANYERSLLKANSRYDDYVYGNDMNALNESEKRGMDIFMGETGECFHCHAYATFTDYSFRNNGLYEVYPDSGRAHITGLAGDVGKFKVPSLRNVAMTAPYMHDGSIATLEEVVSHYNTGLKDHPNRSSLLKPMNLSPQQQQDLVNFLKALTDK